MNSDKGVPNHPVLKETASPVVLEANLSPPYEEETRRGNLPSPFPSHVDEGGPGDPIGPQSCPHESDGTRRESPY